MQRILVFSWLALSLLAGAARAARADHAALATAAVATCNPADTALCLANHRFRVEVSWTDFQGHTGAGHAFTLSGDTGYFWFFDDKNVELVIKVLDGRGLNGHFWVFYGALSNVRYAITVTDTVSGQHKSYVNPSGHLGSVADTAAFAVTAASSAPVARPGERVEPAAIARAVEASLAEVDAAAGAGCTPTPTSLCLNQGRFRAEVSWRDFQGNTGQGQAIALTPDTGYFWFFDPANVELVVKVLDGRALNQYFWVFYGALSTVEYQLKVTDTVSGRTHYYFNPSANLASIADTAALGDGAWVQAVTDGSRAVTQHVPTTGGTLSANGADGSAFTLDIPAGALLSDQDVTLTPVTSIQGLPLSGGLAAAVHIEPEGLILYESATLTIQPAVAVARSQEITFSYQGTGAEFFLHPPLPVAGAVRLPILHFSGYGLGRGTQADLDAQALRLPTLPADQFAQRLAARLLPQARSGVFGPSTAGDEPPLGQTTAASCGPVGDDFRADYRDSIVTRLPDIVSDCEKLRLRTPDLRWFIQFAQALGCGNDLSREIANVQDFILSGQVHCYNQAFTKCVNDKDPAQVAEILRWRLELGRDGHEDAVDPTKLDRCLRFELDFESTMASHSDALAGAQFGVASHLETKQGIPIRYNQADFLAGSGPLAYDSASFTGSAAGCTETIVPKSGSTFTVGALHIRLIPSLGYVPIVPPTLQLDYSPGNPLETTRIVCPAPNPSDTSFTDMNWFSDYLFTHFDELDHPDAQGLYSTELELVGTHAQYAIKVYQLPMTTFTTEDPSSPFRHVSEDSTIVLLHKPQ